MSMDMEQVPERMWIGICPLEGWNHAVVFPDPSISVSCPFCWRAGKGEQQCDIVVVGPDPEWMEHQARLAQIEALRARESEMSPAEYRQQMQRLVYGATLEELVAQQEAEAEEALRKLEPFMERAQAAAVRAQVEAANQRAREATARLG